MNQAGNMSLACVIREDIHNYIMMVDYNNVFNCHSCFTLYNTFIKFFCHKDFDLYTNSKRQEANCDNIPFLEGEGRKVGKQMET